jgi:glycine/D-amino acid oxidase-like deaminating enzyme/nitrite reductase/ring-hydroxylating ferredoxin subunit
METASLWMQSTGELDLPAARGPVTVDVAVVGGGITGVTAALLLKEAGARVALVEAAAIAGGTTGHTTAKVTSNHGLIYDELSSSFGEERAAIYAEAQEGGLGLIAAWVRERGIACDFRRRDAWTYALDDAEAEAVGREVAAADRAGLDVTYETAAPLPFPIAAAIRYADQAEFHPRRYLQALARLVPGDGSHAFEHSRVTAVTDGSPCRVETPRATIQARHVVIATGYPILDRGLFFPRLSAQRSYVLAARLAHAVPEGMFLSTESPAHSVRAHPAPGGGEYALLGGEGHKTGQSEPVSARYAALEAWARERFDVATVELGWATQDAVPADGLPYVGALHPFTERLLVATGYRKWGMTNGTAAAIILADRILGRENPWAETFDPNRFRPPSGVGSLVRENINVGVRFVRDRLQRPAHERPEDLAPGEGAIVEHGGERVGAYRAEDGALHVVSPVCTHLGCWTRWNDAERTWDCPCHGSRYSYDGSVVQGPAVKPLEAKELAS